MTDHSVTAYAKAVLAKKILTGNLVRLACKRHLNDLKTGHRRKIYFSEDSADHAIDFFSFLRLDGDPDKPFVLLPWQKFIVGSLFGWLNVDGTRRYRTAYIEAGKGSGKTPLAAGIGDYGLCSDGEWAAEIFCAAVTRDQAHQAFRDAARMAEASPDLSSRLDITEHNIAYSATNSFLRPVSSEGRSLDAKRVHMAIIDEIHEHRTSIVVDKMDLGKKARKQPLILEITNSGYDRNSICYQHHEYSRAVLEGRIQNDSWFAYICRLDACRKCRKAGRLAPAEGCKKCDDWRDEKVWVKTNPSLEIGLPRLEYLRDKVREASGMPAKQNIIKRLNFCVWTEAETRWLDMDLWDKGNKPIRLEELRNRICFGGLDLSSNRDLSSFVKLFPPVEEDDPWIILPRFWIPEENVEARVKKDGVPYDLWIREGFVETTPGNVIDKDFIEHAILEDAENFKILHIGFDRFFADQLTQHLESERPEFVGELTDPVTGKSQAQWCIPVGMGFYSMAAPCKEFDRLIQGKAVVHGGNPVLRWNAGNVSVKLDPAGNMKPDKEKSTERIDGIVATLMALYIVQKLGESEQQQSVYSTRGILTLRDLAGSTDEAR